MLLLGFENYVTCNTPRGMGLNLRVSVKARLYATFCGGNYLKNKLTASGKVVVPSS